MLSPSGLRKTHTAVWPYTWLPFSFRPEEDDGSCLDAAANRGWVWIAPGGKPIHG